jgi:hypothetical protein
MVSFMATRTKDIFITLSEIAGWLSDVVSSHALAVFVERRPDEPLHTWNGTVDELASAHRVFLAEDSPSPPSIAARDVNPARLGWVVVGLPRMKDRTLYLCQLGARSDWWNEEHGKADENPDSIRLFDRVWRRLRPRTASPVWAVNVVTGASQSYRDIAYTKGAKRWASEGGVLRQEGVANVEFAIRDQ